MLHKEKKVDLRILRTRRSVIQAMTELVEEKGLHAVTISEIAERAMINRATFYAHFADKYDLFAYILRDFFQGVLNAEVSDTAAFNRDNL
jgi:AcrR family transcriptional regulator